MNAEQTGGVMPPAIMSDRELVDSIAAGDCNALAAFVRRYDQLLFRTARGILKDDAEAEDAVQEAFLHAYRALGSFRHDAKLSTWLVRIVANIALDRVRKRAHRSALFERHLHFFNRARELWERPEHPDEALSRADVRRLLEAKIDELPDPYRAVFVLRAIQDLSVEEIADALGIPGATVRSRYSRARSALRKSLTSELTEALGDAFGFAGERCERMVSIVVGKIEAMRQ